MAGSEKMLTFAAKLFGWLKAEVFYYTLLKKQKQKRVMERLFVEGKDLAVILREAKERKHAWEARMRVEMANIQRRRQEEFARFEAFCDANGL